MTPATDHAADGNATMLIRLTQASIERLRNGLAIRIHGAALPVPQMVIARGETDSVAIVDPETFTRKDHSCDGTS